MGIDRNHRACHLVSRLTADDSCEQDLSIKPHRQARSPDLRASGCWTAHLQPQPIGVPGELCIAGHGLARGYLNRPELTAERFIEIEVFGRTERLYRSGDLARWCADGNLEYLGRLDHQIKLRGFRIELGEIEATLTQHPAVREAVVIVFGEDEQRQLAAYFTLNEAANDEPLEGAALIEALRTHLAAQLPDYMRPSSFTLLDSLPLTPNGKLDRRALPEPEVTSESAYRAPRDTLELALVRIWEEILSVRPVGVRDNFFALGGHSLLAVRLMSQLRARLGKELPLASCSKVQPSNSWQ